MHARKSVQQLGLLAQAPSNLDTFVKAAVLLDGLERNNDNTSDGEHINGIVREKIQNARQWFEILCGVGENGDWDERNVRRAIRSDLSTMGDQIADDGRHFKRWPAASPAYKL